MLGRYTGRIVLRPRPCKPPAIPGDYYPRKRYPAWRNKYGVLVVDHQVTPEQETAEIRARHKLRREYNRRLRAARSARQKQGLTNVAADHRALDEPDA
jgi:hypothetical protein